MSILIKGMDMPESCLCCAFNYDLFQCLITGETTICLDYDERPINCPLVPVPPHGRLIDADALKADALDESGRMFISNIQIFNAPTVIPAED